MVIKPRRLLVVRSNFLTRNLIFDCSLWEGAVGTGTRIREGARRAEGVTSGYTWTIGQAGKGIVLTGATDRVLYSGTASQDIHVAFGKATNQFTFEALCYLSNFGASSLGRLLDKSFGFGFSWMIDNASGTFRGMRIGINNVSYQSSSGVLPADTAPGLYHLKVVFDRYATQQLKFYVNGKFAGGVTNAALANAIPTNAVGVSVGNNDAINRNLGSGNILYFVRAYNVAFSPQAVARRYANPWGIYRHRQRRFTRRPHAEYLPA